MHRTPLYQENKSDETLYHLQGVFVCDFGLRRVVLLHIIITISQVCLTFCCVHTPIKPPCPNPNPTSRLIRFTYLQTHWSPAPWANSADQYLLCKSRLGHSNAVTVIQMRCSMNYNHHHLYDESYCQMNITFWSQVYVQSVQLEKVKMFRDGVMDSFKSQSYGRWNHNVCS